MTEGEVFIVMVRAIFVVKFKMAATTQSLYISFSRKRKALEQNLISYEMSAGERLKRQCEEEVNFETEFCQAAALSIILACKNTRKERGQMSLEAKLGGSRVISNGMMRPLREGLECHEKLFIYSLALSGKILLNPL